MDVILLIVWTADGRTLAILRAYANESETETQQIQCYMILVWTNRCTILSLLPIRCSMQTDSHSPAHPRHISHTKLLHLSLCCHSSWLYWVMSNVKRFIQSERDNTRSKWARRWVEIHENLSSENDDDLLFDWISKCFVKMILKYAETWTWWAMQTDIYQQTIVLQLSCGCEEMNGAYRLDRELAEERTRKTEYG